MEDQHGESVEHGLDKVEGQQVPSAQAASNHLREAEILRREDRLDEALHECDLAVELAPDLAGAHNQRGIVLEQLGRTQEAEDAYRRAVDLDPYLLDARNNLQKVEAQLRAGPGAPAAEGKRFWIRAGAFVIDAVAFYVLHTLTTFVTVTVLLVLLELAGQELRLYRGSACCIDYLVPGALFAIYFAVFEWLYGASLGKILLRMRVIMVSGERCTLGAALIRAALRYVDGFVVGIPAYVVMKAPLYQRIGDKSAKTIVVGAGDPIIRESRDGGWFFVALVIYLAFNTVGSLVLIGASSIGP
jgi:uncharacterized RDD family membrane protein YckC